MSDATVTERIKRDITENPVLLYMKGTPVFPQCGFSAAVVQILTTVGVKFKGIDVLADPEIREGIKEFSSWPTIPQLYGEPPAARVGANRAPAQCARRGRARW